MRNIASIHTEPAGSRHLEHIASLRWAETSTAGERAGSKPLYESTRSQMYTFVKNNPRQAYVISLNDDTYSFLEAVDNGHVQYVKTTPDSTTSDNLLSLPRY